MRKHARPPASCKLAVRQYLKIFRCSVSRSPISQLSRGESCRSIELHSKPYQQTGLLQRHAKQSKSRNEQRVGDNRIPALFCVHLWHTQEWNLQQLKMPLKCVIHLTKHLSKLHYNSPQFGVQETISPFQEHYVKAKQIMKLKLIVISLCCLYLMPGIVRYGQQLLC